MLKQDDPMDLTKFFGKLLRYVEAALKRSLNWEEGGYTVHLTHRPVGKDERGRITLDWETLRASLTNSGKPDEMQKLVGNAGNPSSWTIGVRDGNGKDICIINFANNEIESVRVDIDIANGAFGKMLGLLNAFEITDKRSNLPGMTTFEYCNDATETLYGKFFPAEKSVTSCPSTLFHDNKQVEVPKETDTNQAKFNNTLNTTSSFS